MPARLRDIRRVAAEFGIQIETPSGTSHWKARRGEIVYTIPAHNGLNAEITDVYINALIRCFGLDRRDFWKRLRG